MRRIIRRITRFTIIIITTATIIPYTTDLLKMKWPPRI
jgi:hypothetical protein